MSGYAAAAIDRYTATMRQIEKKKTEDTRFFANEIHAGLSEVAEALNQIANVMRMK
jgi:hypothetical protein